MWHITYTDDLFLQNISTHTHQCTCKDIHKCTHTELASQIIVLKCLHPFAYHLHSGKPAAKECVMSLLHSVKKNFFKG